MRENCKIALCQMSVVGNKPDNLEHARQMVDTASQKGARIVVLPEIFNVPYDPDIMAANAENYGGPTTSLLSALACRNKIILVGGSIPEKDDNGKIYNTSYVFDEKGAVIGKHRKMHLFDIDLPGQISFKESSVFSAGASMPIIRHQDLVLAVIICYDVRFPELARMAALAGVHLLVVPAAFNTVTGPAHWDLTMRCRALDNQLFVAACSPARNPKAGYHAWGHSLVADPWGKVLNEAGIGEEIIEAELDWGTVAKVRRELPLLKHRRTDIYELNYKKINSL